MRYCNNCGTELKTKTTYCTSCGNYLKKTSIKTDFVVDTNYIKYCSCCGEELNNQNYCSNCGSVGYINILNYAQPKNIIKNSIPSINNITSNIANNIGNITDIKFDDTKVKDIAHKSTEILHDKLAHAKQSKIYETVKDAFKDSSFLTNALIFTAILNVLIIVFGFLTSGVINNFYPNLDNSYGFKSEINNIVINYALMYGLKLKFLFYSNTNFNIGFLNNTPGIFLVFNFIFVLLAVKLPKLITKNDVLLNYKFSDIIKTSLVNTIITSLLIYVNKSNYNYKKGLALFQINMDAYFSFSSDFIYMFLKIFIITVAFMCIIKYFDKLKFVLKTFLYMLAYTAVPTLILFFVTIFNGGSIKNIFDGLYYFVMILYNTLITFLTGKLFIGSVSSSEINSSLTISLFSNTSLLIRILILVGFLYFIFIMFIRVYNYLKSDVKTFKESMIFVLKFSICMSFIFYILSSMTYNNLIFNISTAEKSDLLQKLSLVPNINDSVKITILSQDSFYILIRSFVIIFSTSLIACVATRFNIEKYLPGNSLRIFLKVYYPTLAVILLLIFLNLNGIMGKLQKYVYDFSTSVKSIETKLTDYKLDGFYNSIYINKFIK